MIGCPRGTHPSLVESLSRYWLSYRQHLRSFWKLCFPAGYWYTNGHQYAPLLADLFLHTFEYNFMVKTMKQDITKAIQFNITSRYINDLFGINNVDLGNYISVIYPSELRTFTDTSTSSTEVCYLNTNIKTGGTNTPFRISLYDKSDDFTFRIVIWTATFPAIQITVFIYLNWWDMLEFALPKLTSWINSMDFHYVSDNKAL